MIASSNSRSIERSCDGVPGATDKIENRGVSFEQMFETVSRQG
jgi:hypothetical protein